jgi:hypothetical protein
MDYTLHLDASCLNDKPEDRNKVAWYGGLETIKRVSSLTHDLKEKTWTWNLEDLRNDPTEWERGIKFLPEFKKWALSFNHNAVHNLICSLEGKVDRLKQMAFYLGELIKKYERKNHRDPSKRVMLKEINQATLKFIKERPFMARTHFYGSDCPVVRLSNIELNEKFTD